jgi:hypothetical protein
MGLRAMLIRVRYIWADDTGDGGVGVQRSGLDTDRVNGARAYGEVERSLRSTVLTGHDSRTTAFIPIQLFSWLSVTTRR